MRLQPSWLVGFGWIWVDVKVGERERERIKQNNDEALREKKKKKIIFKKIIIIHSRPLRNIYMFKCLLYKHNACLIHPMLCTSSTQENKMM